jgi:Ca2+/H+ antiporter
MALVAGVVWYLVASVSGDPNWFEGAAFVVVFGVVVTLGWYYSGEREQ